MKQSHNRIKNNAIAIAIAIIRFRFFAIAIAIAIIQNLPISMRLRLRLRLIAASLLMPDLIDPFPDNFDARSIERFWQIEDVGCRPSKLDKVTDEAAIQQFQNTVQYENGRYHVAWPWKSKEPTLPNNYSLAYGRLRSVLARLQQDSKLFSEYDEKIREQYDQGIIELAPEQPDGMVYYMTQHH